MYVLNPLIRYPALAASDLGVQTSKARSQVKYMLFGREHFDCHPALFGWEQVVQPQTCLSVAVITPLTKQYGLCGCNLRC
jgi:hypothetical protein